MDGARPSRFAAVVDPVLPAVNGDGRPIVKVVFVAGATGKQGGSVARFLLAYRDYGWHVKCLTRNLESPQAQRLKANGAEVVEGRLEDRPRMEQLLRGVHSAFLNTTHDIATGRRGQEAEVQQGQSFVDAAVAAGVKFLVYSALPPLSGNEEARPKLAVQQYIRKKGVPYCWVVPAYYAENFIDVWPPTRDLRGRLNFWMLPSPEAGNVVMPHTSMDDFGGVVRGIMKQHVEYIGRSVLVVSDVQPLKFFMAALAAAVLEPVDVAPIPKEAFRCGDWQSTIGTISGSSSAAVHRQQMRERRRRLRWRRQLRRMRRRRWCWMQVPAAAVRRAGHAGAVLGPGAGCQGVGGRRAHAGRDAEGSGDLQAAPPVHRQDAVPQVGGSPLAGVAAAAGGQAVAGVDAKVRCVSGVVLATPAPYLLFRFCHHRCGLA
ncbi:unnamed protein product, partial [Phaeothamnion confervicola]